MKRKGFLGLVLAILALSVAQYISACDSKGSRGTDISVTGYMTIGGKNYVFKGKAVKPKVKVYYGSKRLKKGKEFKLSFENNTGIGYGKVIATGTGEYCGSLSYDFPILPRTVQLKKLLKIDSGFEATWKASGGVDGYEVEYSLSSSFSDSMVKRAEGVQSVSAKFTDMEPNKTYYVRLRSYKNVSGSPFYSAWSKTKSIKVGTYEKEDDRSTYLVVDLSGGTNARKFPVSYFDNAPAGGWGTEYKTTKMVFRLVPAGSFIMGSPEGEIGRGSGNAETRHEVTLTKSFYIGVFEVTQKQYELLTGKNPSEYKGDTFPVERIYITDVRGAGEVVDNSSVLGTLRRKTDLNFDLPTEAQWEYACRAGTTTTWNNGTDITGKNTDPNLDLLGRYHGRGNEWDDDGKMITHLTVGSFLPNAWGLYDMHGNVAEICRDYYYGFTSKPLVDPVGEGYSHVIRGGSWGHKAAGCRAAVRITATASEYMGFRIVLAQ